MSDSRLTELQQRVLRELAGHPAGWTLTGGGALVGFHTRHRTTRDLDLFWHGRSELGTLGEDVLTRLQDCGLAASTSTTSPHFTRYLVRSGEEQLVVDLVADPVACIEAPHPHEIGGRVILVDTAHEILVNKLTTLVQRMELRDLIDVGALLDAGGDLRRAMGEAPRKDSGFSPLTLVWLLRELPIESMAKAAHMSASESGAAMELRDRLVREVSALADPGT